MVSFSHEAGPSGAGAKLLEYTRLDRKTRDTSRQVRGAAQPPCFPLQSRETGTSGAASTSTGAPTVQQPWQVPADSEQYTTREAVGTAPLLTPVKVRCSQYTQSQELRHHLQQSSGVG